jgi:hypothetical protein
MTFAAISAGNSHTCGVTGTGDAYCWGDNFAGKLGDETATMRLMPVAVHGGLKFARITAGGQTTCGITTAAAAYCWGQNTFGALGTGGGTGPSTMPSPVAGQRAFQTVAAGDSHTCGLSEGAVFCWGLNYGPTPVIVPSTSTIITLTAGNTHTCGVTSENLVMCWGGNSSGQLGDGTTTSRSIPLTVFLP